MPSRSAPGGAPPADGAARYTVQSVARALRLVEFVAAGPAEGRSLSELASEVGTSKSAALALARTLTSAGYLHDSRPGPRYVLGMTLVRMGDLARGQLPLGEACRPLLAALTDATKMTSRIALAEHGYPVFIDRVDGPGSVRFHAPLGSREIPYATAAGKAILAAMPEREVRDLCAQTGLQARSPHTITDIDTLLKNLAVARQQGFAVDDEEDAEGIFCVGAAFFGHDGACAGAVSITGIKHDLPSWRVNELGRTVRECADRVSAMLGGPGYSDLAAADAE
jgi:IclR family acetate operon transcriptional repressor